MDHFKPFMDLPLTIEYVEISECQFNHSLPRNGKFLMSYNYNYMYENFLKAIYNKKFTGLIVAKNKKIIKILYLDSLFKKLNMVLSNSLHTPRNKYLNVILLPEL
jgi:hypothetical protein